MEKGFDRWNGIKKATDAAHEAERLYFREGEVWWVRLGKNIGYETDGKTREFTRPIIILKKYNQFSFLALPLTTAEKPGPYCLPIGTVVPVGGRRGATSSSSQSVPCFCVSPQGCAPSAPLPIFLPKTGRFSKKTGRGLKTDGNPHEGSVT
jgi:hypothetical protein